MTCFTSAFRIRALLRASAVLTSAVAAGAPPLALMAFPAQEGFKRAPAFPGAEGFAKYTSGGRHGRVLLGDHA